MMKNTKSVIVGFGMLVAYAVVALPSFVSSAESGKGPVKVFILAGQSNMEGQGIIEFNERRTAGFKRRGMSKEAIAKKRKGSIENLIKDPDKANAYKHIVDKDGGWIVRRDVRIYYERNRGGLKKGGLTVGFGANDEKIGPEFQFGHIMGDYYDEPVLLIKTAWGGKSLAVDFRSPGAGNITFPINKKLKEKIDKGDVVVGRYYRDAMAKVHEVLRDLGQHFPEYEGRGFEIAGFCWHQGWNDGCDEEFSKEYERNMPIFIRDVRKELGVPDLPFVIANSGFGGHVPHGGVVGRLQKMVQPAQAAAARDVENVQCVDTRDFYRPEDESPGRGDIEHWFSNAESYFLIGDAMGKAMKHMLSAGHAKPDARKQAPGKAHFDPVIKNIEGWTVHVDPQMLEGEHAEAGERALTMLASHLQRIAILMPADRLEKMRKLEIWIEHDHPEINVEPGPYHPSVGWLTARGYDARLAKKVHVTRAASLLSRHHMIKHPAVILHELAHAYHDQVLGFDEPRIKAAYDKAMKAGLYEEVMLYTGRKVRAYAANNPKEYFAEGTEAYFYRNDFYPFVRAELKEHDPVLYDLLEEIWCPMN